MAAGFFGKLWGKIKNTASNVANVAKNIAGKAWDGIKKVGGDILGKAGAGLAQHAGNLIGGLADGVSQGNFSGARDAWNTFKDGAKDIGRDVLISGRNAGQGIAAGAMRDAAGAISRVPGYN